MSVNQLAADGGVGWGWEWGATDRSAHADELRQREG